MIYSDSISSTISGYVSVNSTIVLSSVGISGRGFWNSDSTIDERPTFSFSIRAIFTIVDLSDIDSDDNDDDDDDDDDECLVAIL